MHACMYVCMLSPYPHEVHECIPLYVCMYVCMYVGSIPARSECVRSLDVYMYLCVHVYVSMHIFIYFYIYIHTHRSYGGPSIGLHQPGGSPASFVCLIYIRHVYIYTHTCRHRHIHIHIQVIWRPIYRSTSAWRLTSVVCVRGALKNVG